MFDRRYVSGINMNLDNKYTHRFELPISLFSVQDHYKW